MIDGRLSPIASLDITFIGLKKKRDELIEINIIIIEYTSWVLVLFLRINDNDAVSENIKSENTNR